MLGRGGKNYLGKSMPYNFEEDDSIGSGVEDDTGEKKDAKPTDNITLDRTMKPKSKVSKDNQNNEQQKEVKKRIEESLKQQIEELIPIFKQNQKQDPRPFPRPYCNKVEVRVSQGDILNSDLPKNKSKFETQEFKLTNDTTFTDLRDACCEFWDLKNHKEYSLYDNNDNHLMAVNEGKEDDKIFGNWNVFQNLLGKERCQICLFL